MPQQQSRNRLLVYQSGEGQLKIAEAHAVLPDSNQLARQAIDADELLRACRERSLLS